MRSLFASLLMASALAGCTQTGVSSASRGVEPVNMPVLTRTDYAFDASAPGGVLAPGEAERLNGWFRSLGVGYGDAVYVDGGYSSVANSEVAAIAGNYGLMVTPGAPVTSGGIATNSVRVVVSRARAEVPNCPNWDRPSAPNWDNSTMPNFGCAVNSNLAAMVANPEDLFHGQAGSGIGDSATATRAINVYRKAEPTGTKGLQDISTRKGN